MKSQAALLDVPSIADRYHWGLRFLIQHLVPAEDGSGSFINGKTHGRVLETALTLHILRQANQDTLWQRRLRGYLQSHLATADGFSQLIGSAVLGLARPEDVLARLRRLMGGLEYGRRRKHALLAMLLVELGSVSLEQAQVGPEDFSELAAHRFSQIYCASLRLMYYRRNALEVAPQADVDFLVRSQARNGSWEQQTLLTLLAMMGLGSAHPAFRKGLEFISSLEREDGGIPFIDNQDVWVTALSGLALQAEGVYPEVQEQLASYLIPRQQANGGWTFTDGVVQTDTDDTANCVQMLLQRDRHRFSPVVDRALDFFRQLQREDGGYPTYEREGESEITMTANILLVQSLCVDRHPHLMPALRSARRFLLERQRNDGRFEKSWSVCESYSIFRVLWALDVGPTMEDETRMAVVRARSMRYLRETQRADGGWGQSEGMPSDALSTAYALASLSLLRRRYPVESARITRAVHYLLSQQDPKTGGFVSIPDVAGPRPIPFDLPLLSTVFSLLALSFARPVMQLGGVR
jgi:squalene-hopene/tetraprenyl-beta-curcumene cyclase